MKAKSDNLKAYLKKIKETHSETKIDKLLFKYLEENLKTELNKQFKIDN